MIGSTRMLVRGQGYYIRNDMFNLLRVVYGNIINHKIFLIGPSIGGYNSTIRKYVSTKKYIMSRSDVRNRRRG